jgi:phage shock protein E
MSNKRAKRPATPPAPSGKPPAPRRPKPAKSGGTSAAGGPARRWLVLGAVVAVVFVVAIAGFVFLAGRNGATSADVPSTRTGGAALASQGTVVQGNGGQWTNVSADTLAAMLAKKDFAFVNVKTPYIGEIEGTDLYIPYTDLAARASELPTDKSAPIVVYCRSGNESAIAAQTLIDGGYTDIVNLDGGMNAWTASGRRIVNKNRG